MTRRYFGLLRLFLAMLLVSCSAGTEPMPPADDVEQPLPAGDANRGRALAVKSSCAACHGGDYAGDGSFTPNITPDVTGIRQWTDAQLSRAIRGGFDDEGEKLCSLMAPFQFTDRETADVIAFLRSLPPIEQMTPSECPGHGG